MAKRKVSVPRSTDGKASQFHAILKAVTDHPAYSLATIVGTLAGAMAVIWPAGSFLYSALERVGPQNEAASLEKNNADMHPKKTGGEPESSTNHVKEGHLETVTLDGALVRVAPDLSWQVVDPLLAIVNFGSDEAIKEGVLIRMTSVTRNALSNYPKGELVERKAEVESTISETLTKELGKFGIAVHAYRLGPIFD